ncbi:MAG: zf-HC2 domain-containing protein [Egibacteraceae bacterium]
MRCDEMADRLTDLLEGDLSAAEEQAALAHLATCPNCELVLADVRGLLDAAPGAARDVLDPEARKRLRAAVVAELSSGDH